MASSKKKPLTVEEHEELGKALAAIDGYLLSVGVRLRNSYGEKRMSESLAYDPYQAVRALRWELENRLYEDHPEAASVWTYFPKDRGEVVIREEDK